MKLPFPIALSPYAERGVASPSSLLCSFLPVFLLSRPPVVLLVFGVQKKRSIDLRVPCKASALPLSYNWAPLEKERTPTGMEEEGFEPSASNISRN